LKFGLGIDAGGTYTDAVIYDFDQNKVINYTKSITNKENLESSINSVLDNLPKEQLNKIKLVSLSTTLATNSCVEDKGRKATLVLIGCDRNTVVKFGHNYGLPETDEMIFVTGEHGSDGSTVTSVEWEDLRNKVSAYKSVTNAFAVVEIGGMYNPEFEIEAKDFIEEATGLYTVTSSSITRELNFMKRAASALINAQLIPIINEFLDSVKHNLEIRNINVPLVVVRGDGTLMSEEYTRDMPVETLLSGPAASVVGAVNLSGRKNCLVVDMGGTTSDLAVITDGMVKFAHKGVSIGKWQTGTKSIAMKPIGLGGDSHITFNKYDELLISSRRAVPLCYLADKWPQVLEEIKSIYEENRINTLSLCEFFFLPKDVEDTSTYDKWEIPIINALKNGPLSIRQLAETAGTSIYELKTDILERYGIIMRSALTPTDIMHLTGKFKRFNEKAALLGANILAHRLDKTLLELIDIINTKVKEKLYLNVAGVLLENENEDFNFNNFSIESISLLMKGFKSNSHNSLGIALSTKYDLVGIGAPIHVFLPDVAEKLNTHCIIPEYAPVANAVGAITGSIAVEEAVVIKPIYEAQGISKYSCFSSIQCNTFLNYEEAIKWSKEEAERLAYEKAFQRGSGKISVILNMDEREFTPAYSNLEAAAEVENFDFGDITNIIDLNTENDTKTNKKSSSMLLETIVIARAVGTLKWL
jgi:N-methylhydantoinase A/oxoprolinase/acetone carboxylase beta subunit